MSFSVENKDPDKFDRAIETITGRQLSNRSTPRRVPTHHQQQQKANVTFRRSISMEELGSKQPMFNPYKQQDQRTPQVLPRTNSVIHVPQNANPVQYTSPLQEVQRQVLNDFAAQVQSTLHHQQQQQQFDETNTWDRESIDSLEESNHYQSQKISGPIVRPTPVVNIQPRKPTNEDQQELLRRSYHESFFVKNTPVTGDEQVAAWLGASKKPEIPSPMQKPSSLDGTESETNGKRKSILKRSPSVESNLSNNKPVAAARKGSAPQARTIGEKTRVKDSLEVINTKFLKEMDTQV